VDKSLKIVSKLIISNQNP
jgi:hypothetical protein